MKERRKEGITGEGGMKKRRNERGEKREKERDGKERERERLLKIS